MKEMKGTTFTQQLAACLAMVGFCIPQAALAATPQTSYTPVITDVRLDEGGVLRGQVVTPENTPVPTVDVSLRSGEQERGRTKADDNGCFAFTGLQNGVYQVVTPKGHGTYRIWTPAAAPPAAQLTALVVDGGDTIRGQYGMPTLRNLLSNPWFIAGVIVTAVAVPVAIHNANRGPGSP